MRLNPIVPLALVFSTLLLQACTPVVVGGAAAGVAVAHDRRTLGTLVEDQEIELKAMDIKLNDPEIKDHSNVTATSYNMVVLLTGQVDSPQVRERYEMRVRQIPRVKHVIDEITVGPFSTFGQKTQDTYITTKAKLALLRVKSPGFDPSRVKVVTEQGVVYLMGLTTREEADMATEAVRNISGVRKVVKVFEYIQSH